MAKAHRETGSPKGDRPQTVIPVPNYEQLWEDLKGGPGRTLESVEAEGWKALRTISREWGIDESGVRRRMTRNPNVDTMTEWVRVPTVGRRLIRFYRPKVASTPINQ